MKKIICLLKNIYNSDKLPLIIILIGIIFRFYRYLYNKALWLDEAMLSLNIIERSFLELLKPLDYRQTAPIGFLMIEKFFMNIFGNSEYALRLFPFICGIAALFLFYKVAKRYINPKAVPIALGLFAISEPLIYYSAEVKQYSSDVFIMLSLLLLADYIKRKGYRIIDFIILGLVGALAIWFSHPSIFILSGIGLTLSLMFIVRRDWKSLFWSFVSYLFWLCSFLATYFISLSKVQVSSDPVRLEYWADSFMPFPPKFYWLFNKFFEVFRYPAGLELCGMAAFAFLVGLIFLYKKDKRAVLILIIPIFLTLIISVFKMYPFQGRLLLFIVPVLLLLIGEGLWQFTSRVTNNSKILIVIFLGLFFIYPLVGVYHNLKNPGKEEIRPVISYFKNNKQKDDALYVYYCAVPAFKYYQKRYGYNDAYVEGIKSRKAWEQYSLDLHKLKGKNRVWFIFSHIWKDNGVDEEKLFLYFLKDIGIPLDSFRSQNASIYLYDLSYEKYKK